MGENLLQMLCMSQSKRGEGKVMGDFVLSLANGADVWEEGTRGAESVPLSWSHPSTVNSN